MFFNIFVTNESDFGQNGLRDLTILQFMPCYDTNYITFIETVYGKIDNDLGDYLVKICHNVKRKRLFKIIQG